MIAQAKGRYVRVAPRKVRQVIDLIRGKDAPSALAILTHTPKAATHNVAKVLNSAISNAKQKGLTETQLYVSRITADQGPALKRYRAASFGRASVILKKTTHITIELDLVTQ